jgi:anhydro-N-acetylmuramic acid kinase
MTKNYFSPEEWLLKPRVLCGLMTGTSLDGVDTAIVKFNIENDGQHKFELIAKDTYPLPGEINALINKILSERSTIADVSSLNFIMSEIYAECINKLCISSGFSINKIDAVGMHGQTVWHNPFKSLIGEYKISSTLQLGSVSALSQITNKTVVGDFRSADIALGGLGAPLVPIFDYEFLSDSKESRIILNIGGIANISLLPKNCSKKDLIAFDTGPGNVLINIAANKYFDIKYDTNGNIARTGKRISEFFNFLARIPFINKKPPKSTGRELFNYDLISVYLNKYNKFPENILRTLTDFTAWSIAENIRIYAEPNSIIIASGGGTSNLFLIEQLKKELEGTKINMSSQLNIPTDAKEAICFAYLAYRTLGGLTSNLPSVTGAKREVKLGVIAFP